VKGEGLTKACLRSSETRRSNWRLDYAERRKKEAALKTIGLIGEFEIWKKGE
jgi:hypothetical protein